MTPHNEAKENEIAKIVIMPGDPLRAKLIADNYLENAKLVNSIRNMYAYTGTYKGKEITVMGSGMGMPSVGIYAYELYTFYNVETIIRIGSCGSFREDINIFDTILVDKSYTEGNFAFAMNGNNCHTIEGSREVMQTILNVANNTNTKVVEGNILCNEYFDPYIADINALFNRLPKELNLAGSEMESFALFYIASVLNKKAACLLTVVDSIFEKKSVTALERQNSLNKMIELALESSLKL